MSFVIGFFIPSYFPWGAKATHKRSGIPNEGHSYVQRLRAAADRPIDSFIQALEQLNVNSVADRNTNQKNSVLVLSYLSYNVQREVSDALLQNNINASRDYAADNRRIKYSAEGDCSATRCVTENKEQWYIAGDKFGSTVDDMEQLNMGHGMSRTHIQVQ